MALDDVKNACKGGSKMGAFILASCFIDYMAGFMKGGGDDHIQRYQSARLALLGPIPRTEFPSN